MSGSSCAASFVVACELAVADVGLPKYLRAFGLVLLKPWTSSRADDLQGASVDDMVFLAEGLKGALIGPK